MQPQQQQLCQQKQQQQLSHSLFISARPVAPIPTYTVKRVILKSNYPRQLELKKLYM
jgi:hypothetical protein